MELAAADMTDSMDTGERPGLGTEQEALSQGEDSIEVADEGKHCLDNNDVAPVSACNEELNFVSGDAIQQSGVTDNHDEETADSLRAARDASPKPHDRQQSPAQPANDIETEAVEEAMEVEEPEYEQAEVVEETKNTSSPYENKLLEVEQADHNDDQTNVVVAMPEESSQLAEAGVEDTDCIILDQSEPGLAQENAEPEDKKETEEAQMVTDTAEAEGGESVLDQGEADGGDVSMSAEDEEKLWAEEKIQSVEFVADDSKNTRACSEVINESGAITGDEKDINIAKDQDAEVKTSEERADRSEVGLNGKDNATEALDNVNNTEIMNDSSSITGEIKEGEKQHIQEEDVKAKHAESDRTEDAGSTDTGKDGDGKSEKGDKKTASDPEEDWEPQKNSGVHGLGTESEKTSGSNTIEEKDGNLDEPVLQLTEVKSGAEVERATAHHADKAGSETLAPVGGAGALDLETAVQASGVSTTSSSSRATPQAVKAALVDNGDDDDVVVLDDDDEVSPPAVKKECLEKDLFSSNNDMGIQIESISGGAEELHNMAEQHQVKQESSVENPPSSVMKKETQPSTQQSGTPSTRKTPSKTQTCIVCKRVGKCKYNIVRNGDIKHLCDDTCFRRFRANPTMYLKSATNKPMDAQNKSRPPKSSQTGICSPGTPVMSSGLKTTPQGYKTCVVCLIMNINNQGHFCTWKGMDFCGEGCLGNFQHGISTTCSLCKSFIPLTARSSNCLKVGNQIWPFCSARCCTDYKQRVRLCTFCQKNLASASDSFSAPVGSGGSFKEFCSQPCMKKFENLLNSDVEIIRVEKEKLQSNKCSVCQKVGRTKHAVKYSGVLHNLCSDPCLSAFRYANKLDTNSCDFCNTICSSLESSPHTVVFEGNKKRFCSDTCVAKYRFKHHKVVSCSWCGSQQENFDMIERLDSNNKYQLFCSLNCLSLFRVNLQAKSNQAVTCDLCHKLTPAQYHLTMSDASVRNFCSFNCVMTFQSQFSKGTQSTPPASAAAPTTPAPVHKHNTRGKASNRGVKQSAPTPSPSVPIISNVISLAPQGNQTVNIKNSTGAPVVVSKASSGAKTTSSPSASTPVQQKIIIQPPAPKSVKNKSLLCKPFTQTKATSCRPHAQAKECQTDEVKQEPALIPVPVPVYLPTPMALYSSPSPTPLFIPIPIPVPIFIPTTRKSANGIMKHIKEIMEKTPSDPLEAELLMMAAAVSGDGNASDSGSDEETLPEINRSRKRPLPTDDDEHGNVLPLIGKPEDGGEEDMISMALRMAEEMSGPITDLESAVEAVPINQEPPAVLQNRTPVEEQEDPSSGRRTTKQNSRGPCRPKRPRLQEPQAEQPVIHQEPVPPPDQHCQLKFSYGVNAWRHWVMLKNTQIEHNRKPQFGHVKLFKTDVLQCTPDELNFSLCLFVKEVRKPSGDEYSPDSIYYLTLGIQQYLYENGRIDNIFADYYYEQFTQCLTELLSKCQPKFNSAGQMVCRIEEEHLWECKQLGAHSPYVLLNTLIYFHTKFFMLKTPEDHMKLSFAHILKYWKKGLQTQRGGQLPRSVSLRYYSVSTARKDGSAPTSTTRKGSKEGIPVYEVSENQENPLRCPVKLYEFFLSKCPESIKNRSDIFYPVPERSCVPDSPVWYSTVPISQEVMTRMLTRILLVREIQEAHLHSQPIFV